MPQQILPMLPAGSTPITDTLSVVNAEGRWTYFQGTLPVFTHAADDQRTFQMFAGQLAANRHCKLVDIEKAFGVSAISVKRMVKKYRAGGCQAFYARRRGRGASVLTEAVIGSLQELLDQGWAYREAAQQVGVKSETVRKGLRRGILRAKKKDSDTGTEKSERSVMDAQATMGMACTNSIERMLAALGWGAAPLRFEVCRSVTLGGVLCALPALAENGLFQHQDKLPPLPSGYYTRLHILLLLAYMALCRIRTAEELRYQPPGELGKLMALDRIPEVRTLRIKLAWMTQNSEAIAAWASALSEQWLQRDPEAAGVLYVDGHVRVYHGELAVLPRRYVSRERLCLRGTTDYWVNDQIGQPYFVISCEFNDGLLKMLREQIVPRLLQEVPNQPSAEQLQADPWRHRFLLVFDREGSSAAFFQEMWQKHRIACVSYRKQPLESWEPSEFTEQAVPMPGGIAKMQLAERGTHWGAGLWVRELRKRSPEGQQTSLITTAYALDGVRVAAYLFSRWSQENFIKYMMEHFAIDALSERGAEEVDETTEVVNPAWRQKDAQVRALRQKLQIRQARYASLELDTALQTRDVQRYQAQKSQLQEELTHLQKQWDQAKTERRSMPRRVTVKDLPETEKIKRLRPLRKQFLDTIKMIAYRAETGLCALLREEVGRLEDVRPLMRDLFRHEANLIPDPEHHRLTVEVHHMTNPQADLAIAKLFDKLNALAFPYPGTDLVLHYKLVS